MNSADSLFCCLMTSRVRFLETDESLVDAARTGSTEALAELYRRHADVVYRVAYSLLPETADAEDVLQDVFVGLPEALSRFDRSRPLEPWLKRVAARTALSRNRSARRREERAVVAVSLDRMHRQ